MLEELLTKPGASIDAAVFGAAEGNRKELLEELLKRPGASINEAVRGAAAGNHGALRSYLLTVKKDRLNRRSHNYSSLSSPLTAAEHSVVLALNNLGKGDRQFHQII